MMLFLLTLAVGSPPDVATSAPGASAVSRTAAHEAIVNAVRARMGAGVEVVLQNLTLDTPGAEAAMRAVPDPDARLGSVIRFKLQSTDGATWLGSASARVTAIVPHLHAAQPLLRGAAIGETDVTPVSHEVAAGPLRAWPGAASTIGGTVSRALASGACLSRTAVQPVLAVRTGQEVTAVASVDGVEARAVMVAAGGGDAGAVIRVVNRQSRRALKARVVAPGLVEIIK